MQVKKTAGKTITMWSREDVIAACPMCAAPAVVPLPRHLVDAQPDDTTHVCHPGFGGCNHGFALNAAQA